MIAEYLLRIIIVFEINNERYQYKKTMYPKQTEHLIDLE